MSPPTWYGSFEGFQPGSHVFQPPPCVRCRSTNLELGMHISTAMGFPGGPERDGNHHHQTARCLACGFEYTMGWVTRDRTAYAVVDEEEKAPDGKVTRVRYLIAGTPSEGDAKHFVIVCSCRTRIKNRQWHKSVHSVPDLQGRWVHTPPSIWDCPTCGYSGEAMPTPPPAEE